MCQRLLDKASRATDVTRQQAETLLALLGLVEVVCPAGPRGGQARVALADACADPPAGP